MLTILLNIIPSVDVSAASYITVEGFLKYILAELKIPLNNQPYIDVAIREGIIKEGEFKDYKAYLTRTDAAVIAKRLDEKINLHYNYTQEVYDILSGCNYYDGRLYYNCKGKLYPVGATKDTYPAEQFLDEVLRPVLLPAFQKDNWAARGLRAGYMYVTDKSGNIVERYIEIGVKPEDKYNIVGIDPFNENSFIIKAWKKIKEGDRKFNMVLNYRISDINKVPKSKREAVAYVMAKGIFKGYSDGMYVLTRSFKGNEKITAAGAKDVVQKVLHPEKRALVSPEGLLIRTTNLPKNAGDFEYILDCFPNEYYETRFEFTYYPDYKNPLNKKHYAYPKEMNFGCLYDNYYSNYMDFTLDRYKYFDDTLSQVYKYLNCVFNVNYKTVNDKWKEELRSCYANYYDYRITKSIEDYINGIKANHVIVESEIISIDPASIYYYGKSFYIRAYVKYKLSADSLDTEKNKLIYANNNNFINLKNGEWRYGIYDIMLYFYEKDNRAYWGIDSFSFISDTAFRG